MNFELNSRQLTELLQCIRIGIYRAKQDAKNQTALDVRQAHLEEVKRRKELLRIFGG